MLLQAATFAQGPGSTTGSPRTDALADLARTAGWSARVVRSGDAIAEAWSAVSAPSSPVGADR
jgi:hypothetical protein